MSGHHFFHPGRHYVGPRPGPVGRVRGHKPPDYCWQAGSTSLLSSAGDGANILGEQLPPQSVAALIRIHEGDQRRPAKGARARSRSQTPLGRAKPPARHDTAIVIGEDRAGAPTPRRGGDSPEKRLKRLQERDAAAQGCPRLSAAAAYLDNCSDGISDQRAVALLEGDRRRGAGRAAWPLR